MTKLPAGAYSAFVHVAAQRPDLHDIFRRTVRAGLLIRAVLGMLLNKGFIDRKIKLRRGSLPLITWMTNEPS